MSAIAHYLEDEGIATTLVALIREHAESAQPPRALWVPFQLGRPVGAPLDKTFQQRVLRRALSLLDSNAGPVVLQDFEDEEPDSSDRPEWSPPSVVEAIDLRAEVAALRPWYEGRLSRTGRTTVGISGAGLDVVVDYLVAVDSLEPMERYRRDLSPVQCLRYAADDLKAYCLEAITEASSPASGWQLANWFWTQTHAGALINSLRRNSLNHPDEQRRYASWWLVPDGWSDVEDVGRTRTIGMPESLQKAE